MMDETPPKEGPDGVDPWRCDFEGFGAALEPSPASHATRSKAKVAPKLGCWAPTEDRELLMAREAAPRAPWTEIACHVSGRSGKQCRERFTNSLSPAINRSPWTAAEDALVGELLFDIGPRWSRIARQLPGRTDLMVKNRYYVAHQRRLVVMDPSTDVEDCSVIRSRRRRRRRVVLPPPPQKADVAAFKSVSQLGEALVETVQPIAEPTAPRRETRAQADKFSTDDFFSFDRSPADELRCPEQMAGVWIRTVAKCRKAPADAIILPLKPGVVQSLEAGNAMAAISLMVEMHSL